MGTNPQKMGTPERVPGTQTPKPGTQVDETGTPPSAPLKKLAAQVFATARIAKLVGEPKPDLKGAAVAKGRERVKPLAKPLRQSAQRVGPHHEVKMPWPRGSARRG